LGWMPHHSEHLDRLPCGHARYCRGALNDNYASIKSVTCCVALMGCPVSVGFGAERYRKVGLDGVGWRFVEGGEMFRSWAWATVQYSSFPNGEADLYWTSSLVKEQRNKTTRKFHFPDEFPSEILRLTLVMHKWQW